jgi:enamine deaminase RidA (YjgF/YER057c/UK114 family)
MTNSIERIAAAGVPAPAGHYSHATSWRDLVFASGQLGARSDGSHTADRPFETQVRQALDNVLTVLAEAGCGREQVLRVTAYIAGVENWPAFNRVYADGAHLGALDLMCSSATAVERRLAYRCPEGYAASPGSSGAELDTDLMVLPHRISFLDLMETARSLPPEVRADPNRLTFTMAVTIIRHFFGKQWCEDNIIQDADRSRPDGFLRIDFTPGFQGERKIARILDFAEMLFNPSAHRGVRRSR